MPTLATFTFEAPSDWRGQLDGLWPVGRLVELASGPDAAQTSAIVSMLASVQQRGEVAAWIAPERAGLYPPGWAGLDLASLLVVQPPPDLKRCIQAAEILLRTRAVGALVIDLSEPARRARGASWPVFPSSEAWLGRLLGLAREGGARVLVASPLPAVGPSLGALVSMRLFARRVGASIQVEVLKDKAGLVPARAGLAKASPPVEWESLGEPKAKAG